MLSPLSPNSLGASAPHVRPPLASVPPMHSRVATRTPATQTALPSTHVREASRACAQPQFPQV